MTAETGPSLQGFHIENNIVYACNGIGLKNLLGAGKTWLETHTGAVNRLNVFPVPDGDTGTNMLLTMRAALQETDRAPDPDAAGPVAQTAAFGALMGARGNSGVILSQYLQGLAAGLQDKVHFTTTDFAHAAHLGTQQAYQSVQDPVEGTILTVARVASDAAQHSARSTQNLMTQLAQMVEAARTAQARTPELLPLLKEAGVTDAGGQGLLYIFEGWLRFLQNRPVEAVDSHEAPLPVSTRVLTAQSDDYGYDVQFLLKGERLDAAKIRSHIDRLGWSTVVTGGKQAVKVHLHTHDPGAPLSYAASLGTISYVVVEDLAEQARGFLAEASAAKADAVGTVAVVPGPGFAAIFRSLGAERLVTGGPTQNPSTQKLLDAVNQSSHENVLIFPNHSNIMLAAQKTAALSSKRVRVVPTQTLPQGIAALIAFNPELDVDSNVVRLLEAARRVTTVELTHAVRDTQFNGASIGRGAVIGLVEGQLRAFGRRFETVTLEILAKLDMPGYELLTIYFGQVCRQGQAEALAQTIKQRYSELEIEIYGGGQPHYNYIISLE